MTVAIAVTTPRPVMAVTPILHHNSKKMQPHTKSLPSENMMVARHPLVEDSGKTKETSSFFCTAEQDFLNLFFRSILKCDHSFWIRADAVGVDIHVTERITKFTTPCFSS
jgi:hypothetical protein